MSKLWSSRRCRIRSKMCLSAFDTTWCWVSNNRNQMEIMMNEIEQYRSAIVYHMLFFYFHFFFSVILKESKSQLKRIYQRIQPIPEQKDHVLNADIRKLYSFNLELKERIQVWNCFLPVLQGHVTIDGSINSN